MLTENQGSILLRLARQTIERKLGITAANPVSDDELVDPALQVQQGVFVTLKINSILRGCIGNLLATESIIDGTRRHAENAAFHDHRFPPLSKKEVKKVTISISVLSKASKLDFDSPEELLEKLATTRSGVILQGRGSAGATFLPQVWDQLPEPQLFLSHLCRKAGLSEMAWRSPNIDILTYSVQSFREDR